MRDGVEPDVEMVTPRLWPRWASAFHRMHRSGVPAFETSFTPCVEIGWRLARPWWGQGLATEGARAALTYGFERLQLPEIVSFTLPGNMRSRRVMEKLGMLYSEDFEHPGVEPGHRLRRHVLYRLPRGAWVSSQRS